MTNTACITASSNSNSHRCDSALMSVSVQVKVDARLQLACCEGGGIDFVCIAHTAHNVHVRYVAQCVNTRVRAASKVACLLLHMRASSAIYIGCTDADKAVSDAIVLLYSCANAFTALSWRGLCKNSCDQLALCCLRKFDVS